MSDDVVEKLLKKLTDKAEEVKAKIEELNKIHYALELIKEEAEVAFDIPDVQSLLANTGIQKDIAAAPTERLSIRSDTFYGMSYTDAAEKYLKMIGHAVPFDEIYNTLAVGGITFDKDGRKNLNTSLTRATRKFAKIGKYANASFGLIEWYPMRRKSNKANTEQAEMEGEENEEANTEAMQEKEKGLTQPE